MNSKEYNQQFDMDPIDPCDFCKERMKKGLNGSPLKLPPCVYGNCPFKDINRNGKVCL